MFLPFSEHLMSSHILRVMMSCIYFVYKMNHRLPYNDWSISMCVCHNSTIYTWMI